MMKKMNLLGVVLLIAGQLFAQQLQLVTVSADGSQTVYALSDMRKIVFKNNTMTVNMKSEADVTGIVSVRFNAATDIETIPSKPSVFVDPNPVKTQLTVAGVEKNVRINLFHLNGALLQNILTQDNPAVIDVSSLQPGIYLLQIGDRTVKFVKQ
jgi:hypothetical protein